MQNRKDISNYYLQLKNTSVTCQLKKKRKKLKIRLKYKILKSVISIFLSNIRHVVSKNITKYRIRWKVCVLVTGPSINKRNYLRSKDYPACKRENKRCGMQCKES